MFPWPYGENIILLDFLGFGMQIEGRQNIGVYSRMTAGQPIGTTRGKSKVSGLRKPKEIGNKPKRLVWQEWQLAGL